MNKCHICGQDAFFTCRQCGKPVCNQHHSFDNGKCAECNGTYKKVIKEAVPHVDIPGSAGNNTRPVAAHAKSMTRRKG